MKKNINEELLGAWLKLSVAINNEKVVSDMPYNEALICNILYRNRIYDPLKKLTATDLCNATKMQKSQMNRTLNNMEEKSLIVRERSELDKRQVFVSLNMEQNEIYERQHVKILEMIDSLTERLGEEKSDQALQLFTMITNIAEEIM